MPWTARVAFPVLVPIPAFDRTVSVVVFVDVAFTFALKIFNVWTAFEANTLPTTCKAAPGTDVFIPTSPAVP